MSTHSSRVLALAVLVQSSLVGWSWAADSAMTNADVIRLTNAGVGESVIVAMIESSVTDFETGVGDVLKLAEGGVGDAVIRAMVAANRTAEETFGGVEGGALGHASHTGRWPDPVGRAELGYDLGSVFREALRSGGQGPEMVVVPAGQFRMGCLANEPLCSAGDKEVSIAAPFALSVYEITFEDYDRFTNPNKVNDEGWGRGPRPIINVSWDDAKEYVAWLSLETGAEYRLPSEAEWEYAARAGTTSEYSWGNEIGVNRANCNDDCGDTWQHTAPVGSFMPNGIGLHDMHGNVAEWVEDCWNDSYARTPSNGSAWVRHRCSERTVRGGSWRHGEANVGSASRFPRSSGFRDFGFGFRVARTLTP